MNRAENLMIDAAEALKLICIDPTFGGEAARKEAKILEKWGYFQVSTDSRIEKNRLVQAFSALLEKIKCSDFLAANSKYDTKLHDFDLEDLKHLRPHIRQLWRKHGRRPIIELHGALIADLQDQQNETSRWQKALSAAIGQLRHWIMTEQLAAWGRRGDATKAKYSASHHEQIPPSTFLNEWTTFQQVNEEEFWIMCSVEASTDEWTLPRQCWGNVKLSRNDLLRLHKGSSDQSAGNEKAELRLTVGPVSDGRPWKRRKKTGLDYREADESLVAEGVEGVRNGTYRNATDAGRALAKRAVGTRNEASRATRLIRRISERLTAR